MARKSKRVERVVYEEKPQCGRCGAGIVGVVPRWFNEKPLCRECTFELEQIALRPGGRNVIIEEEKAPPTPEELTRRTILIGLLAIMVLLLMYRIYTIAPMLQPRKPLRLGVTATDALTDQCIEQMWKLSRDLQDGKLPNILPLCPKSSRQYIVTELVDDTAIRCPAPEEHGLARLAVTLSFPIPVAEGEAGAEQ